MYAAIRQAKAKTGTAEELARRIKEGAIPIISDVDGFRAYYVVYAPDDTVTAISIFNKYEQAEEANRRAIAWIEKRLDRKHKGRHTRSGDRDVLNGCRAVQPRDILGDRRTQFGNAEIQGVKRLAGAKRGHRRVADIPGRDLVGFAEPEREDVGLAQARVGHFTNLRGDQGAHRAACSGIVAWNGRAVVHSR